MINDETNGGALGDTRTTSGAAAAFLTAEASIPLPTELTALSKRRPSLRMMVSNPAHFVSFGFGTGLAPFAPGTFGALLGLLLARWLHPALGDPIFFALLALATVLGIGAMHVTGSALGEMDHGAIVWDEVIAMALIVALLPGSMWQQAWAFLLFRILDIRKPGPVGWADRNIGGAMGVMLDDLIAAAIVLLTFAVVAKVF
jgi:phosphatidylglycerophosphatase A